MKALSKSFMRLIALLTAMQGISWYLAYDDQYHALVKEHRFLAALVATGYVLINYILLDSWHETQRNAVLKAMK
ncbi:hypothetical protein [Komagataeibacter saccharivorans]|uniref:hypothetical protein n=1 Tax=Komagataeibacter saccharivorans TaxID=265959 RepID=UPI0024A99CC7|nr:hypothetical protein [Komagataeibacter saccharivorans]